MLKKIKDLFESPLAISLFIFFVVALVVLRLNALVEIELREWVIELNGFLGDVVIFAVLIVWLNKRREKRDRIRLAVEMLDDFRFWKTEEGINRKVGIIRRLIKSNVQLPSLEYYELAGAYLKGLNLKQVNLNQANLSQAFFLETNLNHANMEHCSLEKAVMQKANLERANLIESYLGYLDARETNFQGANLRLSNCEQAIFWNANLADCNFEGACLNQADFFGANLEGVFAAKSIWGQANLKSAKTKNLDVRGADLSLVEGLIREQIESLIIDEETILPEGFSKLRLQILEKKVKANRPLPTFATDPPPYRTKEAARNPFTMSL